MGVRGLHTYIQEKQRLLSSTVTFTINQNVIKPIVIDGWSFIYQIFYESTYPWVYGGEYEAFSRDITRVIQTWESLGLRPHFVFDGAQPLLKVPEHIRRIEESKVAPSNIFFRTSAVRRNEPTFLHDNRVIPPLMYGACVSTLLELGVHCVWAESEGDQKCVELAASLGTWVLARDSDFVILNAEGYEGYVPSNLTIWHYKAENTAPTAPSEEDGWVSVKAKGKGRGRSATLSATELVAYGTLPPTKGTVTGFQFAVFKPQAVAEHFKIPISFLPLLSSLVGNDFVPRTYRPKLMDRRKTSSEYIDRVGQVLHEILTIGRDKRTRIGKAIIKNMASQPEGASSGRPSVATLIRTAIQELLMRQQSSEEIDEMVEHVIDSILQYGAESDPEGPFAARVPLAPHPSQESVKRKYTRAYHSGDFAPRILDVAMNGVFFAPMFLEDPDIQTCGRTVATDLLVWTSAVLNDGLPLGKPDGELASIESSSIRDQSSSAPEDDDDDELIDVIEEQSDSEDEARRGRSPKHVRDDSIDEDEDAICSPQLSGVPVDLLTSALKRLRRQQRYQGDDSRAQSPLSRSGYTTSGVMSPQPQSQPPMSAPLSASLAYPEAVPSVVTTYYRSGLRVVSQHLPIPTLRSLLESSNFAPSPRPDRPNLEWKGPVVLQPTERRMRVFLHATQSNVPKVYRLTGLNKRDYDEPTSDNRICPDEFVLLVVALRWVISAMCTRAEKLGGKDADAQKWKRNEAQAFLLSCIQTHITNESYSRLMKTGTDTASAEAAKVLEENQPFVQEATPRGIQLTCQVLSAVEAMQHLGDALLLSSELKSHRAVRKFSGQRFHQMLGVGEKLKPVGAQERELLAMCWEALEESSRAEWWFVENAAKPERLKKKSTPASTNPKNSLSKSKTPGLYKALATLGSDW